MIQTLRAESQVHGPNLRRSLSGYRSSRNRVTEFKVGLSAIESPIRLLVLGSHGVGKSAVIVRYLTRRFIGEYKSQINVVYRHRMLVSGLESSVEIVDISARPGDPTVPVSEILRADCVIIVYSISDRNSFTSAVMLLREIVKLKQDVSVTILGNKHDLHYSRQVTAVEGTSVAKLFGCTFSELSAAESSECIIPIFNQVLQKAVEKRRKAKIDLKKDKNNCSSKQESNITGTKSTEAKREPVTLINGTPASSEIQKRLSQRRGASNLPSLFLRGRSFVQHSATEKSKIKTVNKESNGFGSYLAPPPVPVRKYSSSKIKAENCMTSSTSNSEDSSSTEIRQRKMSVFGRAFGSLLFRGSMPDLSKASTNLHGKFDIFKQTLKKRSV